MLMVTNIPLPFEMELGWNCDFCDKSSIVVSLAGILYCKYCRKTYGESIYSKANRALMEKHCGKINSL